MLLCVFQECLFLVTVPSSEATRQGPSSNKSPVAEEAPGPPSGMNEVHEFMVHERIPESEDPSFFALTVGPIDKVCGLWRMPGLEEPKEEVFAGGDVQIPGILFNPESQIVGSVIRSR
jgi:hypothetical protein